ncbi:DUF389 domain-containing protein [Companilactobacillus furfuricola]|uniref:DUF389 domain-containing protein n=1 Tax=Companilactobacillus furfuricola TaxID=1462575 RepID=UPI000F79A87B|nr:DUF389 domain-containing protein [Companilactobacillus furfuricola]
MNGEDQLLRSDIIDRNVRQSLNLSWINFAVLFCAVIIACVGLNMDSVAVIIGAMLISPIMDPIIGMGYGVAVRDSSMLKKAVSVFLIEIVVGLIAATIYFALSPIKDASEQLLARTQPAIWDVLIAFFGGFAGIIGSAKKEPGNILPGVAIATALIPPLSTVGYGLSQFKRSIVFSAGYLFLINSFFIALATMIGTLIFNFRKNRASGIPLKNQVMIVVAAIIITIPSLISASTLVKQTYNETQLTNFIEKEMSDEYIVNKQFDGNKIKLVVMGANISSAQLKKLDKKLNGYQLGDYKLQLNQLSKGNYLSVNDFKQYVANEKNSSSQPTTTTDDESELLSFKNKITNKFPETIDKVYIGELAQKNKTGEALILVQFKQGQDSDTAEQQVSDYVKSAAKKQDLEYTLHFTQE